MDLVKKSLLCAILNVYQSDVSMNEIECFICHWWIQTNLFNAFKNIKQNSVI